MATTRVEDITTLHVDDDPEIRELAKTFLERARPDFHVETAESGDAALGLIEERDDIDCVVSDYQMPEMDGLEFLEAVRERRPEMPFILFTGKGSEEIASEAISAGVTDYLQKGHGQDHYTVLANRVENAVAQRRAQAAVEDTKRRYQTLIQESSDVIAVIEPDSTVRYVSTAIERVFGYSQEDLVGASIFDKVHPDDVPGFQEPFEELLEATDVGPLVECRFKHADGRWIHVEAEGRNLLDDPVVEGLVIYARDITDRVERQRVLERYEQIVEIAGDGAYVLDEDGHYLMVNQNTVDRTGYSRAELIGTDGSMVFDEEDARTAREAMLEVFNSEDEDYAQYEATVHARDGTEYPVEIRAAPIVEDDWIVGAVGTSRDIAERKQREFELERYEKIVETAGDAAQVIDEDGRYVMVNDTLVERTGYSREELLGNTPAMVLGEEGFQRASRELRAVRQDPEQDWAEFEVTVTTADGEEYPIESRVAPILEDGEFRGSVGISREIADRKRRERELERQNERLSNFAGVVSHDLRNPLNVAQARTEIAREDVDSEHLDVVADAHRRMERLIEDLLTLAREGRTVEETQSVDLGTVAREAWASVQTGDATLEVEADIEVQADRSRLWQALENLFRNAVEHGSTSPPSLAQEDAVGDGGPAVTVTIGPLTEGGFFVADDGVGLGDADPDKLFEADYSTKPDGTGLGLAIVREIIQAHGWDIHAVEEYADGVRFDVHFDPAVEHYGED